MELTLEQINERLTSLLGDAEAMKADAEAGTKTADEVKAFMDEVRPEIEQLKTDRKEREATAAMEEVKGQLTTLHTAIEDLRKPQGIFVVGERGEEKAESDDPYISGSASVYADIKAANKGNQKALSRLTEGFEGLTEEGKAMTEGVDAQGGYLVRPQVERQLVEAIELDNVMRQLCSQLTVNTNSLQLDQLGLTTTAGWVAELAQKPESTGMTLAMVTANVFTAAGLATISNQLLADSNPAVDQLVTRDLAKRLTAVEESAFLTGSGSGQPLGLLNTPGLGATPLTSTTVVDLLNAILDAVAGVETALDTAGNLTILMHPRTWTRILKGADSQGAYFIDPTGGPQDPRTGLRGPAKSLWGYRVVTSNRIPTNLGAGTNESRVVVGDFSEALILDRQGITVDESPHVYFTTNQTVFRAEKRVGFTAARTPEAFNVVGGAGMADG
jgi:HK97 family phage major capsid protein